jgi:hypothetical protein
MLTRYRNYIEFCPPSIPPPFSAESGGLLQRERVIAAYSSYTLAIAFKKCKNDSK